MEEKLLNDEHLSMAREQIESIVSLVMEHKNNPEQAITLSKQLNIQIYSKHFIG